MTFTIKYSTSSLDNSFMSEMNEMVLQNGKNRDYIIDSSNFCCTFEVPNLLAVAFLIDEQLTLTYFHVIQ